MTADRFSVRVQSVFPDERHPKSISEVYYEENKDLMVLY